LTSTGVVRESFPDVVSATTVSVLGQAKNTASPSSINPAPKMTIAGMLEGDETFTFLDIALIVSKKTGDLTTRQTCFSLHPIKEPVLSLELFC